MHFTSSTPFSSWLIQFISYPKLPAGLFYSHHLHILLILRNAFRILIDFITVCSELVAAKRPFRNIIGNCSPAQKVFLINCFWLVAVAIANMTMPAGQATWIFSQLAFPTLIMCASCQVAAMLAYLSLDQERYIDDIISSRFKSLNELLVKRNVAGNHDYRIDLHTCFLL